MTTRTGNRPNCFNIQSVARFFLKDCHNAQPGKAPTLATMVAFAAVAVLTAVAPPAQAQSGPVLTEVAKLLADDGVNSDQFGWSVAIDGNTAIVGAPFHFDNGLRSGSAYIFVRDDSGGWMQQAQLLPADAAANDYFGWSVSISGDTAVVGAIDHDGGATGSGSAYIFERSATGDWTQRSQLLPNVPIWHERFGASVAIDGETVIVGANGDDDNGPNSGSAYVFTPDANGAWTQSDKLLASDGMPQDSFGCSVAIDGDTVIVGALYGDGNVVDSGSSYIFVRDSAGAWTQQIELFASDGELGDRFGYAVAQKGDTAVFGAIGGDGEVSYTGAAYVFARDPRDNWTQQAKLLAADGVAGDQFGISVDICDETVVVGKITPSVIVQASGDLSSADTLVIEEVSGGDSGPGSAYVFMRDTDDSWKQQAKLLASDGDIGDNFGFSTAINGNTIVAGAIRNSDNGGFSGSAYIFNLRPADLNANGVVDGDDLSALLSQWGTDGGADLNGDGVVDGVDLATLLTNWG